MGSLPYSDNFPVPSTAQEEGEEFEGEPRTMLCSGQPFKGHQDNNCLPRCLTPQQPHLTSGTWLVNSQEEPMQQQKSKYKPKELQL